MTFARATYIKAHEEPPMMSKVIVVTTGVAAAAPREMLGMDWGDSEDKAHLDRLPGFPTAHAIGLSSVPSCV